MDSSKEGGMVCNVHFSGIVFYKWYVVFGILQTDSFKGYGIRLALCELDSPFDRFIHLYMLENR